MPSPRRKHTKPAARLPGDTSSSRNFPRLLIIDDESLTDPAVKDQVFCPVVEGQVKGHGLVPRKHSVYPPEMFDPPSDIPLYSMEDISRLAKELDEKGETISNLLTDAPLDQNGQGYCWAYSSVATIMAVRNINNQPYVRLNPHSIAAVIKQGQDQGGWCGLSAKGLREIGVAPESVWPGHQYRNWRSLYTEECKREMAKFRIVEDWVDLTRNVYDQNLTQQQLYTCLLAKIPCATDYNWWAHSVMACDCVLVEGGSLGTRIRNSWGRWGDPNKHGVYGFSILRGSRARVNGAVATRAVRVAA